MKDRGWTVITLDIDPTFQPSIVANIRTWSWSGPQPDLIWCSPPCTEFSKLSLPWNKNKGLPPPDMSLVNACRRIIREAQPRYWVIENVKGAIPYLGAPQESHHPYHLWGHFPHLGDIDLSRTRRKDSHTSANKAKRALIPYQISRALAIAIETQLELPLKAEA